MDTVHMEFLEFVCVMTAILVTSGLIFVHMSTKNAIKMQELAEKMRISQERSKAARTRYEGPQEPEVPGWLADVLGGFGVSPDVIFQDEMPPELARYMPAIKGFIQGGGIQKFLGGAAGPSQPTYDPKEFI